MRQEARGQGQNPAGAQDKGISEEREEFQQKERGGGAGRKDPHTPLESWNSVSGSFFGCVCIGVVDLEGRVSIRRRFESQTSQRVLGVESNLGHVGCFNLKGSTLNVSWRGVARPPQVLRSFRTRRTSKTSVYGVHV